VIRQESVLKGSLVKSHEVRRKGRMVCVGPGSLASSELFNTSQVKKEPLNYSFASCPEKKKFFLIFLKATYTAPVQTSGANKRKEKDAVCLYRFCSL
jgi:hypothetical protein